MKTIKSKFFALAFVALGATAGITSCGKDKAESGSKENLNGAFVGTHKFTNIPEAMLKTLSSQLPPDSEGNPTDLSKGFDDTLVVTSTETGVSVYSYLLNQTIEGKVTGDNKFSIPEKSFPTLQLGETVEAKNAKVKTAQDVTIPSNALGTSVNVKLSLAATEVAGVTIPLTILTSGDFVKTDIEE